MNFRFGAWTLRKGQVMHIGDCMCQGTLVGDSSVENIFKYLSMDMSADWSMTDKVNHRIGVGRMGSVEGSVERRKVI